MMIMLILLLTILMVTVGAPQSAFRLRTSGRIYLWLIRNGFPEAPGSVYYVIPATAQREICGLQKAWQDVSARASGTRSLAERK